MQTSTRPDISLILVNHRSVSSLKRAVASLVSAGLPEARMEVIVVNNDVSERDRVEALSRRFGFRAVFLSENNGFGHAGNIGATNANGKILGFLNPDSVFDTGSLASLVRFFSNHQEVGIVGAGIVAHSGSIRERWSSGKPLTLLRLFRNKIGIFMGRKYWESNRPVSVGWVSGAALFIRKDVFRELSGFDERFFLYFEDMDLCVRAAASGFKTVLFPLLTFRHEGGKSFHSDIEKKRAYYESQDRYFDKHRPKWEGAIIHFFRSKFFPV